MNNAQCRKAYVSVNVDVDEEGTIHPCFIRWKDGLIFQIDKVLYKCRATSKKVGGGGIRYTVLSRCVKYSASAQRPAIVFCAKAKSLASRSAEPIVFRRLIFSLISASAAEK